MYQGKNVTALQSQRWLKTAFFELLKEMPYEQINVKIITEKAGLARQTFYKLYTCKEEIVNHQLDEMFSDFKNRLLEQNTITLQSISYSYFEYFYHNKNIVYLLINNNLISLVEDKFSVYLNEIKGLVSGDYKGHTQYINSMLSGALLGILTQWFKDDLKVSIGDLSILVCNIFNDNLIS